MSLHHADVDYPSLAGAGEILAQPGHYDHYEAFATGHGHGAPVTAGGVGGMLQMQTVDGEIVATAMQLMSNQAPQDQLEVPEAQVLAHVHEQVQGQEPTETEAEGGSAGRPKKRVKKMPLSPHDAVRLFAHKGIYVDEETGELRTSANHKRCDKWDMYGYTRHFEFKVYKKYEAERLHTDDERQRLLEAKERFFRQNPEIEESRLFRKKRKEEARERPKTKLGKKEARVQERHWMEMWQKAKDELRALRDDLRNEADEEVRSEMLEDIEGLKKRKADWAELLGMKTEPRGEYVTF